MALRVRWLALAALLIGYPLLAHYTTQSATDVRIGMLVAVAPVVLIGLLLAWTSSRRIVMFALLGFACAALAAAWPRLANHFGLLYWLQNLAMHLVLLMTFGRTLVDGRQALCTRFAIALYGPVSPEHARYTWRVTLAWSLFFAAMALTSTLLFFLAPLHTWSIFANFLTLPLVALMFVVEFAARRWALPDMENMHLLDAIRAFRNDSVRPR